MSEHTLDDLAARLDRLRDLMHQTRCSDHGCVYQTRPIGMGTNGGCHCLDGERLPRRIVIRSMASFIRSIPDDTIRQWQASAEPGAAPVAPVVTITEELIDRCAKSAWIAGRCSPTWESAKRQHSAMHDTFIRSTRAVLETASGYLESALCGADLAPEPEGARDAG